MGVIDSGLGWKCDENYYVYDAGTVTYDQPSASDHFEKTSDGGAVGVNVKQDIYYWPWLISTVPENVQSGTSYEVESASVNGTVWYKKKAGYGSIYDSSACSFSIVEVPYSRSETDVTDSAELADAIRIILEAAAVRETVTGYFKVYRKTNGVWMEFEPSEV